MASRRAIAFVILGLGLVAVALRASDTPPKQLHLVNGHWTAWNPPALPEGAKSHVVVHGDTFWALAKTNLGNPYLWPQMWEKNKYVEDAHWIYPGDPIQVDVAVASPTSPETTAAAGAPPTAGGASGAAAGGAMAGGPGGGAVSAAGAVGGASQGGGAAAGTAGGAAAGVGGAVSPGYTGAAAGTESAGAAGGAVGTGGAQASAGAGGAAVGGGEAAGGGTAVGGGGAAGGGAAQGGAATLGGAAGAGSAAGGQAGSAGFANVSLAGAGHNAPVPLGSEDDIYCSGYVGDLNESFGYTIVGSEYQTLSPSMKTGAQGAIQGIYGTVDTVKYQLTSGDIVYLDGGSAAGLSAGTVFTAVAAGREIRHPLTHETVGREYTYAGRVRVLSVQEKSAIAEIVQSCSGLRIGAKLKPFEPEPIPLARRTPLRPVNDPTSAEALSSAPVILAAVDDYVTLGQDSVVYVNRGEGDSVFPGDLFTIYRPSRGTNPPVVLGELAILSVRSHTAVAKILESRYAVYVGDRLEKK